MSCAIPFSSFTLRGGSGSGIPWLAFPFSQATAQELTRDQSDFFENKIRPLLVDECYKCHSQQAPKLKGGLSLEKP